MIYFSHPQTDPIHFEALCAGIEEYEPLPELAPGPADTTPQLAAQEHEDSISEEILAGLVSP